MRIGTAAMNAALRDFGTLMYSTKKVSLYESYLTAKRLEATNRYPTPDINDVNAAVSDIFVLEPGHEFGRLYPFRYDWRSTDASGRKTVWNNTTRGPKLATSIFVDNDLRQGLLPNAAEILAQSLADDRLPAKEALICLVLHNYEFTPGNDWSFAEAQLLTALNLTPADLAAVSDDRPLSAPLLTDPEWSPATLEEELAPKGLTAVATTPGSGHGSSPSVVIDTRVERMLRISLRRYPCLLLVGPPGTGKGTLVRWLAEQARSDPTSFGFDSSLDPNPMWRTPDESWSAFELVGGLAPDEFGLLRWANGLLLNSIKDKRWLVLDETNRAELDKIMGPLLTWLSDQEVEVGRTTPHGQEAIVLGWNSGHACVADRPSKSGEPTRFLAGSDWRLIGTYNPQDAQRVFRMGQALSRRFVVVPIPALKPGQFEKLLSDTASALPDAAKELIVALYSAHHSEPETLLGPGVFLRLARYLEDVDEADLPEHLAEAYIVNVGKFLSAFDDDTFDRLGQRIVDDEQGMTAEQWEWTKSQRLTIG